MKKWATGLLALPMLALGLGACTPVPEATMSADSASAPQGFESYYSQSVQFAPCREDQVVSPRMAPPKDLDKYRCATVSAPMNWDDPDSEPITLALAAYGDQAREPLFYNLGGPGGDAVQSLSAFARQMATPALVKGFQIVALDPRGVGASSPVRCWTDEEKDQEFADPEVLPDDATPEEIVAAIEKETAETGQQCLERTGELLGYVDTDSAARDFDMVRALMGAASLNYIGYSYGTSLGATYAQLFPERVGRMVLDSVLDPDVDAAEVGQLQTKGMEEALDHWLEYCLKQSACPLTGDVSSAKTQLIDFYDSLADNPLPAGGEDRVLTEALARTGTLGSLYSIESYPLLLTGLQSAFAGDGWVMLQLADFYNGRNPDGTYDNSNDAHAAINSLDFAHSEGTAQEWSETAEQLARDYPVFGDQLAYGEAGLESWPVQAPRARTPINREGGPAILVIAATHDPATPYVMAQSLTQKLGNAVLVTREGWDHGSYTASGSACITKIADDFLLSGTVPDPGIVCPEENPAE